MFKLSLFYEYQNTFLPLFRFYRFTNQPGFSNNIFINLFHSIERVKKVPSYFLLFRYYEQKDFSDHLKIKNAKILHFRIFLVHPAGLEEFQLRVMKKIGKDTSENIEWDNSRLICIADYTKYDSYAVDQINRNIELLRYKKFENLLLFELVNAVVEHKADKPDIKKKLSKGKRKYKTVAEFYKDCSSDLKDRFEELSQFIFNFGDGIQLKKLKWYFAFKKIKTFATFAFQPTGNTIQLWVEADLNKIKIEEGFTKDVSNIGHHGFGNLEIKINSDDDLERAKPYILKSYELS